MSIVDQFDEVSGSGPAVGLRAGELAEAARPLVLDRVGQIDREIAGLQAERVQLLGRLGDEAMLQAELNLELDPGLDGDRQRNLQWRSAALELAAATGIGTDAAQAQLAEAWTLAQKCQPTLQALAVGEIGWGQARVIAREVADLDVMAAGDAQEALLPYARRLAPREFAKKAREILDVSDPERVRDRHERAYARRSVSVEGGRDGMATLTAYLDAGDAAVMRTGLANAARQARQADDARTVRQLEADFLVELVMDGEVVTGEGTPGEDRAGADRRRLADLAPVTVELLVPASAAAGDDAAPGKIPGVGMIDPARVRELIAKAPSLRRILTDPITSAILDFDRNTYRVPAELKRMIRLRDEHCRAPHCPRPAKDLDHTIDYARGGKTARGNLAGLCENHHYVKHEAGWSLRQYADGILEWTSPSRRRYQTAPDVIMPKEPPPDPWADPDTYADNTPFDTPPGNRDD